METESRGKALLSFLKTLKKGINSKIHWHSKQSLKKHSCYEFWMAILYFHSNPILICIF